MAITFVGGNTSSKVGATSGTSTIALNSGLTGGSRSSVQAGDLVIAVFGTASTADRTLSITDGTTAYTLIGSEAYINGTFDTNLRIAYKFMGSTPDTSTTFGATGNNADAGAMAVYVFSGVHSGTPLDVAVTTSSSTTSVLVNPAAITPTTAGAFIVAVGAGAHNGGVDTYNAPADLTAFRSVGGDDTNDASIGIGHKNNWTSGSFDPVAWTFTQADTTSFTYASTTIALRPAPNAYSITATQQTYSASTVSTVLKADRELLANQQSYSASGVSTPLTLNRKLAGSAQSYAVTANSADLTYTPAVVAGPYDDYTTQTYDGYGASNTYENAPLANAYTLTADLTTLSVSTASSNLKAGRNLAATLQTYSVSTVSTNLRTARKLTANLQTYSVSLVSTALRVDRKLSATLQTYSASGVSANLRIARKLTATLQTYSVSGVSSSLRVARKLTATQQTYSVSGVSVVLRIARLLAANQQSFSVSGVSSTLKAERKLTGSQQTYTVTGVNANLSTDALLNTTAQSYTVSANSATLSLARNLTTSTASYTADVYNAVLTATAAQPRYYIIT